MGATGWVLVGTLGLMLAGAAKGQDGGSELVGKQVFLREPWLGDQLEFDGAGALVGSGTRGPVTLSGLEVRSVRRTGKGLEVDGVRLALVSPGDGEAGLRLVPVTSTTRIWPSLRAKEKRDFKAEEQVRITVHASAGTSLDQALRTVFVRDRAELSQLVPPYWKCYADSYFQATVAPDAEKAVEACVVAPGLGLGAGDVTEQPRAIVTVSPRLPAVSAELGVNGTAVVHARIGVGGVPVGLQVVRAVGGGADESILEAVSRWRFEPGKKDGVPVPADVLVRVLVRGAE